MHTTQSDKNHKINKPMTHIKSFSYQNICIFAKSNQCDKYHFNLYCYEQKSNFYNPQNEAFRLSITNRIIS